MKFITIGGATQDLFITTTENFTSKDPTKKFESYHLPYILGEKTETNNLKYLIGGGATNSAVSLKRLGFEVSCFCSIGKDSAGKTITQDLAKEKINTTLIHSSHEYKTGLSIILRSEQGGESTIFAYRGANSFLTTKEILFKQIQNCNYLYITSLSNQSAKILPQITEFAHKNSILIATNPGKSQLSEDTTHLKKSLKHIDIFILNSSEAKKLMSTLTKEGIHSQNSKTPSRKQKCTFNISNEHPYLIDTIISYNAISFNLRTFFSTMLNLGPSIVIVTNGCNGVYVAIKNTIYFHPSIKLNVIDTVGAGDAFGSCFVGCIRKGLSIKEALRSGIANSASVLSHIGAKKGLLTQEQLQKNIKTIDPNLLQTFSL